MNTLIAHGLAVALVIGTSAQALAEDPTEKQIDEALNRQPIKCPVPAVEISLPDMSECRALTQSGETTRALQCWDHYTALSEKITRYNAFVRRCQQPGTADNGPVQSHSPPNQGSAASTDVTRRLQDRKQAANGYEAKATQQRQEIKQHEQAEQDARTAELKEEERKEKEEERKEQEQKDRDAQAAADEARKRAAAIEERRRQQQLAEARKWHCYGEQGDVSRGFAQCQSACREYFNDGYCHDQCYASSNGSVAEGRSCFKQP